MNEPPRIPLRIAFATILIGLSLATSHAREALKTLKPFLKTHCHECHGPEKQKNDLRFDTLGTDLSDPDTLELWQNILDQLNLGEMPPKKKPRPDFNEQSRFADTLAEQLRDAYSQRESTGGKTVLRRLNRLELRNTLRDLLHLDGPDLRAGGIAGLEDASGNGRATRKGNDPVREFPADEVEDGFDNIGHRLVMSDFLLKLVIAAAEEMLDRATRLEPKPDVKPRRFAAHLRTEGPNAGLESWSREVNPSYDAIFQRYREPGASTGGSGRVTATALARNGVGVSARYRITIEASAHHQRHDWGELINSRQDEPLLLGLHLASARRGGLHEGNPTSRQVVQWPMPGDGSRQTYTHETWLDQAWTPWVGWENGPYDRSMKPSRLVEKYYPDLYQPPPKKDAPKQARQNYEPDMGKALLKAGYRGPHIRIHSLTLEPLIESWPPRSHVFLFGANDDVAIEMLLLRFARRAYRSPVDETDLSRYLDLVKAQLRKGASRVEALKVGYAALLASPRFYYLQEPDGRLDSHAIASRLSYFLWSSMPDDTLLALAAQGTLTNAAVLKGQVERMLNHRNADIFSRRFTERWLRLDQLGAMPPERGGPFRIYWDRQMQSQMVAQTDAFFADLVKHNGSIRNLIDSDYTFLNERVAFILYERDDVWGDAFRKVALNDRRRGGIFTQPSVMTATANGVDTSPVVRGVWVLENVLGQPPAPPPPDVEPLAPDLRGAKTIREQLAKHREVAACNSCHRKIDPLGFAMESFDPIGRWRERYPDTKRAIDPSASLANGTHIKDIVAFKDMLLGRETDVVRCLTEKMLTYASGRTLEPVDRGEVDRIVAELGQTGNRLRDLIHRVVQSEVFLTK